MTHTEFFSREQAAASSPAREYNFSPHAVGYLGTSISLDDRVSAVVGELRTMPVIKAAEALLSRCPEYAYHNRQHTDNVVHEAVKLGIESGLSKPELMIIGIAAYFHDTGFLDQKQANEPIGAKYAAEAMRKAGYREHACEQVQDAILATALKLIPEAGCFGQVATNALSRYILDADLNNFGKDTFIQSMLAVFQEVSGERVSKIEDMHTPAGLKFMQATLKMQQNHEFCTAAARARFGEQKQTNIEVLKDLIAVAERSLRN